MFDRVTNASDINKPIIGVLDNKQVDRVTEMLNEPDITPKKKIFRAVKIIFIAIIIFWALYNTLFVLPFSEFSAKDLTVSDITVSSEQILSFQLKSNGYSLPNHCLELNNGSPDGIFNICLERPIILFKSNNQMKADMTSQKYEIPIKDISAVYYVGKNKADKFLIWKR